MASHPSALFVFAHQDDEMAAVSRIAFEVARGSSVHCAFLTDGGSGGRVPAARNRESSTVLSLLGVPLNQVHFIGSELPIADTTLPHHLDLALEALERAMSLTTISTVYCLAYEGGHQDHDATHFVAVAFAQRRRIIDRCFEMPLYRGAGQRGPFFRVFSPLRDGRRWERRRLRFSEGRRLAMLALRYPTQRGSWIGLFPEAFVKLAVLRREVLRGVDPSRFSAPPHAGTPFYARRFSFPQARFEDATRPFLARHFPSSSPRLS